MKKFTSILITLSMVFASVAALAAWAPDKNNKLELSAAQALITAKEKDAGMEDLFNNAYADAVFPKVGKGGIGVGGAPSGAIDETCGRAGLDAIGAE